MGKYAAALVMSMVGACGGHGTPHPDAAEHITSISVGAPIEVLAPAKASPCMEPASCAGSTSIDCYGGLASLADEHSTVLPPGTIGGHDDYLFFVPTKTCLNGDATPMTGNTSGLVVLTGGAGPTSDRWTLDFPSDFDAYDEMIGSAAVAGDAQLFLSPMQRTSCPNVAATSQDPTFDLNYANAGSVVVDPTAPPASSLVMIYEGTNRCIGSTGTQDDRFYSTLGVATSSDTGHTWASYRANATPLPFQSSTAGPGAARGVLGAQACAGNDCTTTPAASYGRYAVLGAPVSLSRWIATGQALPSKSTGDSEPSAFVDDVDPSRPPYLYTLQNAATAGLAYPGMDTGGVITIARAQLGTQPLVFTKWYGETVAYGASAAGSFSPTTVTVTGTGCGPGSTAATTCQLSNAGLGDDGGGLESPIFPRDPASSAASFATCQAATQTQLGASLDYYPPTKQYVLTFICNSPADPANPGAAPPTGSKAGAAWFYATLDASTHDLSDQTAWSAPQEIAGTWGWLTSNMLPDGTCPPKGCSACVYDGWYPTFMSLGARAGQLSATGYAFSMRGCQDTGAGSPREYVSRTFTIAP